MSMTTSPGPTPLRICTVSGRRIPIVTGFRCAVLSLPTRGHYAIAFSMQPEGGSLVDHDQQEQWVARYGMALSQLGEENGLIGATVTIAFELASGGAGSAVAEVETAPSARTIRSSPW